jgi:hypothetical protein
MPERALGGTTDGRRRFAVPVEEPREQRLGSRVRPVRRPDVIIGGIFQALQGLAGIVENEFYVTTRNYVFEADATTWGWTHLIIGVIVGLAGLALLSGQTWARVVGIFLAVVSAISNFLFIPYYPLWSLLIIALDVFVIWALAAHGGELRDTGGI